MTPTSTLKIFFCSLLFIAIFNESRAADHGVGVTLLSYSLDTSQQVNLGYTITINAQVTNFDSVPFNGVIGFGLHNSEQTLTNAGIFDQPPYSGDSVSLGPNEIVPAVFSVVINTPYFRPGPDVVVVWPMCNQPIADSILIHLNIFDPNDVRDLPKGTFSYAIVKDAIFIKNTGSSSPVKQVRIYNCIGQALCTSLPDTDGRVPLPPLSSGIYLCELILSDKQRFVFKFPAVNGN